MLNSVEYVVACLTKTGDSDATCHRVSLEEMTCANTKGLLPSSLHIRCLLAVASASNSELRVLS